MNATDAVPSPKPVRMAARDAMSIILATLERDRGETPAIRAPRASCAFTH